MSFLDLPFMFDSFVQLCRGIPLTLQLMALSVISGAVLATILATMRLSGNLVLDLIARGYIFVLRGTRCWSSSTSSITVSASFPNCAGAFWPFLREPYWCAVLALALNTAAYSAEIIRGGVLSVATGQIEAARAYGMSGFTLGRRILAPQALRQMLPAYSNEVILMVKSTALASTITMMEVTGLAAKLISATYRPVEVFICAGAIYLLLNFVVTRIFKLLEYRLSAAQRQPVIVHAAGGNS
ncbi:ABC transporter permease [Brucella pituitosa]|uniref:ABC transporter permease n=1 Tax=Brucella pituitosa TaxID=571256 RepID=UPI000FE1ED70|nr:ABC transporter permease subunit [Brucella pituitosa]